MLMTTFIQPASQPVMCVQTKRHSRKNGKKKIEDCVKRCSCSSRRRRRRHVAIQLGHDDEDTNLWRWFCSWWREETTWQVGWYSRETRSNQAVWPWWETPPTRGRKQATNEPNAISPHDLVVLLWCCAIAALLPWSLPLSHRKTLAPPFSLSLTHKVLFLSTYSLAIQQQQQQPYSKYLPTLLLRSVTPVLCCIRDPPPSRSFCNRRSSSKVLLLLLLFFTPSGALLLHISKTWTEENFCFRSPPRLLPWHGDDDDMQGPPRLLVLQLPKLFERILVAILRKNRDYCLLSTLASRAREDRTWSRAQRKLPGQKSCCSASGDCT